MEVMEEWMENLFRKLVPKSSRIKRLPGNEETLQIS